jgi:hypothetical protein
MQNPWLELGIHQPFVLEQDRAMVHAFNELYQDKKEFVIRTELYPEPFFGNVNAPVYVLILNPGYSEADRQWHTRENFTTAVRSALTHEEMECPLYYLDPRFSESPGAKWFAQKTKHLVRDCGLEAVTRGLFFVELFPYHSQRYRAIPKKISDNGLVPSSAYSAYLVRRAIMQNKWLVIMRAAKQWTEFVPELAGYDRVLRLNSPQNVCLSPGNVKGYQEIRNVLNVTG